MAFRTLKLLQNSGAANGPEHDWGGGHGCFFGEGTFSGGSLTLEVKTPHGTWLPVGASTTLSANGYGLFFLPECKIRAVATTGTGFYAFVRTVNTPMIAGY